MDVNEQGQYLIEFPQLYYQGNFYLSWPDFVELSGMPKSSLFRIIKEMENKPVINIKNRLYYRTDFCIRFHRWKPNNKSNNL